MFCIYAMHVILEPFDHYAYQSTSVLQHVQLCTALPKRMRCVHSAHLLATAEQRSSQPQVYSQLASVCRRVIVFIDFLWAGTKGKALLSHQIFSLTTSIGATVGSCGPDLSGSGCAYVSRIRGTAQYCKIRSQCQLLVIVFCRIGLHLSVNLWVAFKLHITL